jgi:threonine dehydrogenase-like Zn-dependent dehydrogenase
MRAVCWHGPRDVRVEQVPDPEILNARDAIVRVTLTAICGSDLHLWNGLNPTMQAGDILGHEFMGEVVEIGRGVRDLRVGDRVVVPFPIACGACFFCREGNTALCDNSNPNAEMAEALYGFSSAGLFGYSHLYGGYAGGQAELVRVPFADVGPVRVPPQVSDEQALFLSDVFPTGYMAAENCSIRPGDTVAVWGAGPVGQFAILSAYELGAHRVIAIDRWQVRLLMAETQGKAETIDYVEIPDVVEELKQRTGGRGPDACIDAVGTEAHGTSFDALYDRAKVAVGLGTDRPHVLRQAIQACRKGGVVSIPGVYGGFLDKMPMGSAFAKSLTIRMGQTNVHRLLRPLLAMIEDGRIDPSFIISHRWPLERAREAYQMWNDKDDDCTKIVLDPRQEWPSPAGLRPL